MPIKLSAAADFQRPPASSRASKAISTRWPVDSDNLMARMLVKLYSCGNFHLLTNGTSSRMDEKKGRGNRGCGFHSRATRFRSSVHVLLTDSRRFARDMFTMILSCATHSCTTTSATQCCCDTCAHARTSRREHG